MIAYMITNSCSPKRYIGITSRSISERWKEHCRVALASVEPRSSIGRAIRAFGPDLFRIEEIACAKNHRDLLELEVVLISQHNTMRPHGYNHTIGGEGVIGVPRDDVYRNNVSTAMFGVWKSRSGVERAAIAGNISAALSLYETTEDHRKSLSLALKGVKKSAEHAESIARSKMGNKARLGMTNNIEHRAAISRAKMGHQVSADARRKISQSLSGRTVTQRDDHRNHKVTPTKVLEIRASAKPGYVLAELYGVSQGCISSIRNYKTWRSVA